MYSPSIRKFIELFAQFPTIGPRTAARFVFYLLRLPEEKVQEIVNSILDLKRNVKLCAFCFNPFELESSPQSIQGEGRTLCNICADSNRSKTVLCIVEKEQDLASIEQIKKYSGLYFILGGSFLKLTQENLKKVRTQELKERIQNPGKFGILSPGFKEIIIALNPTSEGRTTALYLERELKYPGIKITKLGLGLPVGGELEYADEETLSSALESRREVTKF